MFDYYQQLAARPSYQDSLKVLEADIQHANVLAASIPRGKGGACLQMRLVYNHLVRSDGKPDVSSCGRRATIKEFYSVILPSLQRLNGNSSELDITQEEGSGFKMAVRKKLENKRKISDVDLDREDECGICLESCTKMVVPDCCHAMCSNCYCNWNTRSESCPFCRGSLKRVDSGDLWVLTCSSDVVDTQTVLKEDMMRLSLYINSLPRDIPDALFLMYYEYLF
ncbi:E3 ubiquitin-protein ligase AIRP2-like isoform X2 [Corylus avellana]|uniref:E3 ubiquitin-protein ligase AIRP2-like isoform X2 n=1 Tax=Corylus avellana TaxID=13451 RepID=UPI001E1ED1E9|nr:E3 ubiquitin-protein ligase AIRP2-like isoform X2 [Corylus avellana]